MWHDFYMGHILILAILACISHVGSVFGCVTVIYDLGLLV